MARNRVIKRVEKDRGVIVGKPIRWVILTHMKNTNTMYLTSREASEKPETMTAREMALTAHKLNRDASIARTNDGRKFVWTAGAWVRFG
jgi:hypothetical protein